MRCQSQHEAALGERALPDRPAICYISFREVSDVINPLHTNLYRKSLSLRRTKTDRIDARTIAMMLMSDARSNAA